MPLLLSDAFRLLKGFLMVRYLFSFSLSHELVFFCFPSQSRSLAQVLNTLCLGMKNSNPICVEPGLFQWTRWCKHGIMPVWLEPEELKLDGYNVDTSYKAFDSIEGLDMKETLEDYYQRSYQLVKKILNRHTEGSLLVCL